MLPPPALSFTIPSIHDDSVLQCRVYHPACFMPATVSNIVDWRKRAAIVAHPYAPMGGCYDDPVVDVVAATILKQGYIVGTFNFRGAGSSEGRTSWQSKAEQNDYKSFIGFMVYYLHHISPPSSVAPPEMKLTPSEASLPSLSTIPSQAVPPAQVPYYQLSSPTDNLQPRLLLAGYSYGAMITASLPPIISSIIHDFQSPSPSSSHAEIRLRASHLASQQNVLMRERVSSLIAESFRRSGSLNIEETNLSSPKIRKTSGGVRIGGEEDLRRASHESFRGRGSFAMDTPDRVRRSIDRVRSLGKGHRNPSTSRASLGSPKKKGRGSDSSIEHVGDDEIPKLEDKPLRPVVGITDQLQPSYLLVSPLHGWVSTLVTMWGTVVGKERRSENDMKFTINPTLALFGDDDVFVGIKRLRAWTEKFVVKDGDTSKFRYREVSGAGHFWHHHEVIGILQNEVRDFVAGL